MKIGASYHGRGRCEFVVWAPWQKNVGLRIIDPYERQVSMERTGDGYWQTVVDDVDPLGRYWYVLDGERLRPDPASFFQPQGVHSASQVVDHASFVWHDQAWQCPPLSSMIFYEVHIGTFTPQGTLPAMIERLDDLASLGINAIELMPVAQFPGDRNWGYDGTYLFSVQNSYGGPQALKEFVDAAHNRGIAVFLDVVYNHLGPEGNYLQEFGPYFTDKHHTPWGRALNFDDDGNAPVRDFFLNNALYWFKEYHMDGLRLDAIHGIFDDSPRHILAQMSQEVRDFSLRSGRPAYLVAESDLNLSRVVEPVSEGGYGIDAQWCDDFHHALHALLTGEERGYYMDFGSLQDLAKAFQSGFIYDGRYSRFRQKTFGTSSEHIPASRFVIFSQNHDQIGNRLFGERLSQLISFEALKLAAGCVFFSPYIPLLFMGQEYGETSPFYYFVSHSDQTLVEAVRQGRKREFESFQWKKEPPSPDDIATFFGSKLQWSHRTQGHHFVLREFYRTLIGLRKNHPALAALDKKGLRADMDPDHKILVLSRRWQEKEMAVFMNFSGQKAVHPHEFGAGSWTKLLDSESPQWLGRGSLSAAVLSGRQEVHLQSWSFCVYEKKGVFS